MSESRNFRQAPRANFRLALSAPQRYRNTTSRYREGHLPVSVAPVRRSVCALPGSRCFVPHRSSDPLAHLRSIRGSRAWVESSRSERHNKKYQDLHCRRSSAASKAGRHLSGRRNRTWQTQSCGYPAQCLPAAVVVAVRLRQVGIALDIRSFEFATFYSDVQKGAFQLYSLRWIGGNEDPDIFYYAF